MDFQERFKGRTCLVKREGPIQVLAQEATPIEKKQDSPTPKNLKVNVIQSPSENSLKVPTDMNLLGVPSANQANLMSKSPQNKNITDISIEHPRKGRKYQLPAQFSSQSLSPVMRSKNLGSSLTEKKHDTSIMLDHSQTNLKGGDLLDVNRTKSKQSIVPSLESVSKNDITVGQQPSSYSVNQNNLSSIITPKSSFLGLSKNPSISSNISQAHSQKSMKSLNKSLDNNQNYAHDLNKFKAEMLREFRPFRRGIDQKASDLAENFENSHYLDQISKKQSEIMKKYASPLPNQEENLSSFLKKQIDYNNSPLLKHKTYKRSAKQNFNVEDSSEYREWAKSFKRSQVGIAIDLKTGE